MRPELNATSGPPARHAGKSSLGYAAVLLVMVHSAVSACPASFDEYFSAFRQSRTAQEQGSWYPLRIYSPSGDRCYPDCDLIAYDYNRADMKSFSEAVFPLPREVTERNMTIRKTVRRDRATVRVYIDGSDAFHGTYVFRRIRQCWYLVQVM